MSKNKTDSPEEVHLTLENNSSIGDIGKVPFRLSVNYRIRSKDDIAKYNDCFEKRDFNIQDLMRHVKDGYSFTSLLNSNKRKSQAFYSTQIIGLDFDETISLEEFMKMEVTQKLVAFIYTTISHQKNGRDRFRAILLLDKPLKCSKKVQLIQKELRRTFDNLSDKACSDPCRLWLGAKDCQIYEIGNVISHSFVKETINSAKEKESFARKIRKENSSLGKLCFEQVKQLLELIPTRPGYEIWRDITWAVASHFEPEQAFELINGWSPDDSNGEKIRRLIKEYRNDI